MAAVFLGVEVEDSPLAALALGALETGLLGGATGLSTDTRIFAAVKGQQGAHLREPCCVSLSRRLQVYQSSWTGRPATIDASRTVHLSSSDCM